MDLPDPTERRDRLIAALLAEDPEAVLLRWDAEVGILLRTAEVAGIHVITTPDLAPDRLEYLFSAHVKTVQQGSPPTHFVVVGGGPEAAAALKKAAPFVQPVPMGFHHVDDSGRLVHVTGKNLPLLERAAARMDEGPLDAEPLANALARGQQLVVQERAIVARLAGRHAVTAAITAACVVMAVLGQIWSEEIRGLALWGLGANNGAAVLSGGVYRLFASAFLHANPVHLLVNMIALWSLGPMLEAILGPRRYVILYGASALGGALASAFLGGERWSVGASGAIWGLMGACLAIAVRPKGVIPTIMATGMRSRAFAMLALNVFISFKPGIDLRAHFGGGIVGFALMATFLTDGLIPIERRQSPADNEERRSVIVVAASAFMAFAMAGSVLWGIVAGKPWEIGRPPELARTAIADTGLTIEVPRDAAKAPQVSKEPDHIVVGFGSLRDAPVVFELVVVKRTSALAPEDVDAELEQARKLLNETSLPKWTRKGEAKRVNLGPRPMILVEHEVGAAKVKTYYQVVGMYDVLLRGYGGSSRPEGWLGLEEKVAVSITAP